MKIIGCFILEDGQQKSHLDVRIPASIDRSPFRAIRFQPSLVYRFSMAILCDSKLHSRFNRLLPHNALTSGSRPIFGSDCHQLLFKVLPHGP